MNKLVAMIASWAICLATISSSVSAKTLLFTDEGDYNENLTEEIVTEEENTVEEAIPAEEEAAQEEEEVMPEETVPADEMPEETPQEEPSVPAQEETVIVEESNGTNTIRVIESEYATIPSALVFSKQYTLENNMLEVSPNSVVNLVVIPHYMYKIGNIKVTITDENGKSINGTYTSGYIGQQYEIVDMFQFFMPASNVTVEMSHVDIDTTVTILPSENGKLTYTMDYRDFGHPRVLFEAHPDQGYGTKSITVNDADGNKQVCYVDSEDKVYVNHTEGVTYTAEAEFAKAYNLTGVEDEHSMIAFDKNGCFVNRAVEGAFIYVRIICDPGYVIDELTLTDAEGNLIFKGNTQTDLTMPASDVTATVTTKCLGVSYVDENGTEHVCMDFSNVSDVQEGMGYGLSDGWYVLDKDVTFNEHRMTITGDVNLILCDGATLNVGRGIRCGTQYNNGKNTLTIWAQQEGTGKIVCKDVEEKNAAIGGNDEETAGTINIKGGVIDVVGGLEGAGIGGGNCGNGGTIIISGGIVKSRITNELVHGAGAGIGGGDDGNGGNITILGGDITASGGTGYFHGGAGIGGGDKGSGGTIVIKGGKIHSEGNVGGAGIGGGNEGNGGSISIYGGDITGVANYSAPYSGAGIGGGDEAESGDIAIYGGTIKATSIPGENEAYQGAGIGSGDGGRVNIISILGAERIECHGFRAVGYGHKSKNGTIKLGDNIQIEGFDWNDRYSVLSHEHDLLLRAC